MKTSVPFSRARRCLLLRRPAALLGALLLTSNCLVMAAEPAEVGAPLPTAKELYDQMKGIVEGLRNVRMVTADRSEQRSSPDAAPTVLIRGQDIFLAGDSMQLRVVGQNGDKPNWREGFPSSSVPLTKQTVPKYDGNIYCYRPEGETRFASILNRPAPNSVLYAAYASAQPVTNYFSLPFIGVNRTWNDPKSMNGASLLTDHILTIDPAKWLSISRDNTLESPMIKAVIPVNDEFWTPQLAKEPGSLQMRSVWKAWFSSPLI